MQRMGWLVVATGVGAALLVLLGLWRLLGPRVPSGTPVSPVWTPLRLGSDLFERLAWEATGPVPPLGLVDDVGFHHFTITCLISV